MSRFLAVPLMLLVALSAAGCQRGSDATRLDDLTPTEKPSGQTVPKTQSPATPAGSDAGTGSRATPPRVGRVATAELTRMERDTAMRADRALVTNTTESRGADLKWRLRDTRTVYFDRSTGYVDQGGYTYLVQGRTYRSVSYGDTATKGRCWENTKATRSATEQIASAVSFGAVLPKTDKRLTLIGEPTATLMKWNQLYAGSSNTIMRGRIVRDTEGRITRMFLFDVKYNQRTSMYVDYNPQPRAAVAPKPACPWL